jgi:hypothetical protein
LDWLFLQIYCFFLVLGIMILSMYYQVNKSSNFQINPVFLLKVQNS